MIGFAWRALASPWAAVVSVTTLVFTTLTTPPGWQANLEWTFSLPGLALIIVGPVLAAAVAVDTSRMTSARWLGLWASARSRSRHHVFILVAGVLPSFCGYLVLMSLMAALTLRHGLDFGISPGSALRPLVVLLALTACGAIGSLVGRFLPPVPAGLGAAALVFAVSRAGSTRGYSTFVPFDLSGFGGDGLGMTFATRYALAQVALFTVIVMAAAVAGARLRGGTLRRPSLAGWGSLLVVAALLVVASVGVRVPQYVETTATPTDCGGAPVTFCTYREHEDVRNLDEGTVEQLVGAARAQGYTALSPSRVTEVVTASGDPASGAVGDDELSYQFPGRDSRSAPYDVAMSLIYPYHCAQMYAQAGPSDQVFHDMDRVAATWMSLVGDSAEVPDGQDRTPLTPAQVATIMGRLRSCTF